MTGHLFVYGTLRSDARHEMYRLLADAGRIIAPGWIGGRLYHLGEYPGAVPDPAGAARVRGELYQLHDPAAALALLDEYERCGPADPEPHEFQRGLTEVQLDGDLRVPAWVYWYAGDLTRARLIASGDYLEQGTE